MNSREDEANKALENFFNKAKEVLEKEKKENIKNNVLSETFEEYCKKYKLDGQRKSSYMEFPDIFKVEKFEDDTLSNHKEINGGGATMLYTSLLLANSEAYIKKSKEKANKKSD